MVVWSISHYINGKGPPPGPITNDKLLNAQGVPKENLQRGKQPYPVKAIYINIGKHYRGIHRRVWNYFRGVYGGGPVLARRTIDIYGEAVQEVELPGVEGDDDVHRSNDTISQGAFRDRTD